MSRIPFENWFDEVDAWLITAGEALPDPVVWPRRLVDGAPAEALDIVAHQIELRMVAERGEGPRDVHLLRCLLAALFEARFPGAPRWSSHQATTDAFLAAPGESTWSAVVASSPGTTPVDRARTALYRALVGGTTVERVVRALSRRGPAPALLAIAETGLVSQFDFADRAQRTRVIERKKVWLALAIAAAEARGHGCCVGTFALALEALEEGTRAGPWSTVPEA